MIEMHAMQGDRETCLDAGMDNYLARPMKREHHEATLASRLDVWLVNT